MGCGSSTPIVEHEDKKPQSLPKPQDKIKTTQPTPTATPATVMNQPSGGSNSNANNANNSNNNKQVINVTTAPKDNKSNEVEIQQPATAGKPVSVEQSNSLIRPTEAVEKQASAPSINNSTPASAVKSPYDSDNEDFHTLSTPIDDLSPLPAPSNGLTSKHDNNFKKYDFEQFLSHPKIEAVVSMKYTTEEKLCDHFLSVVAEEQDGYIEETQIDLVVALVTKEYQDSLEQHRAQNMKLRKTSLGGGGGGGGGNKTPKRLLAPPDVTSTPSAHDLSEASPISLDDFGSSPRYINNLPDVTLNTPFTPPVPPTTTTTTTTHPTSNSNTTSNVTNPSPFHRNRKPMTKKKFLSPITTNPEDEPAGLITGEDLSLALEEEAQQHSPKPTTTSAVSPVVKPAAVAAGVSREAVLPPPVKKGFLTSTTKGYHVLDQGMLIQMDGLGGSTTPLSSPNTSQTSKQQVGMDRKSISLQGRMVEKIAEKQIRLTVPSYAHLNYSNGDAISLDLLGENLEEIILTTRNPQERDDWYEALVQHANYLLTLNNLSFIGGVEP